MYLKFSPYAYAKLAYLRDKGETEVAGFGISDEAEPLTIVDFRMVEQEATSCFVEMDGESICKLMEKLYLEENISPERVTRIWIHTHPGNSATPSGTDEKTFEECYGQCAWSVMAILARGGATYARLQYRCKAPASFLEDIELQKRELTWSIDYSIPFPASNHALWAEEYDAHLRVKTFRQPIGFKPYTGLRTPYDHIADGHHTDFDSRWWDDTAWEKDELVQTTLTDETLICGDCDHEWAYVEGGAMKLERCPICDSTKVDFAPLRHRRKKRQQRKPRGKK